MRQAEGIVCKQAEPTLHEQTCLLQIQLPRAEGDEEEDMDTEEQVAQATASSDQVRDFQLLCLDPLLFPDA